MTISRADRVRSPGDRSTHVRIRRWGAGCAALFLAGLLGACGSSVPDPTTFELVIQSSKQINPLDDGRPAAVVVQVFELKDTAIFEEAPFFEIFDDPVTVLGADLLGRRELTVLPGRQSELMIDGNPETRYLGAVAGFRNIDNAEWRIWTPVDTGGSNELVLAVGARSIAFLEPDDPWWLIVRRPAGPVRPAGTGPGPNSSPSSRNGPGAGPLPEPEPT